MSRYLRPRVPGATAFFTVRLAEPGSRLLVERVADLRAALAATRAERPFRVDAWVVLPDHLHAVWTLPEGDSDYPTRWGAIKSRFTRAVRDARRVGFHPTIQRPSGRSAGATTVGWTPAGRSPSKVRKGDAGVWQRRYWEHHVRNEAELAACVRYCWTNPVKHGFVARPEDWPFSSYHRDGRPDPAGWMRDL